MIGIDTNILVRYLTNDYEAQSKKVEELFAQYKNTKNSIFINNIVLCETIWVLERGYKYPKSSIIDVLKMILSTTEFAFDNQHLLIQASIEYEKYSNADLADIIISITNKSYGCNTSTSLDKDACKNKHFVLLDTILCQR